MIRGFLSFFAWLSFFLVLVLLALWAWSFPSTITGKMMSFWPDWDRPTDVFTEVTMERGRFGFERTVRAYFLKSLYQPNINEVAGTGHGLVWKREPYSPTLPTGYPPGVFIDHELSGSPGKELDLNTYWIVFPLWIPILLLAICPALRSKRYIRYRRILKFGLCAKCEYDVRASRERCPECGHPIVKAAPITRKAAIFPALLAVACAILICLAPYWASRRVARRDEFFWDHFTRNQRLYDAIEADDPNLVRSALDAGADPNATQPGSAGPPIRRAITRVHQLEIVRLLLDRGASPNGDSHDEIDQNPLSCVVSLSPSIEMISLLLSRGADPNPKNVNESPLVILLRDGGHVQELPEMVRLLLSAGANPNARDYEGNTALNAIVRYSHDSNLLTLLLSAHADPNIRGTNGQTPLIEVIDHGSYEEIQALLSHNADPNMPGDSGDTPLICMCKFASDAVGIRMLLSAHANPNLCDVQHRTALHYAADKANADGLQALLAAGADRSVKDNSGSLAADSPMLTADMREMLRRRKQ